MSGLNGHSSHIESKDGTKLRVVDWSGELEAAKGKLAFLHGWAEHADRYGFPVEWFTERHWACYGVDVRGHGHSEGMRGFISSFDEYLDDTEAFLAWAKEQADPEMPLFLIGHSQGGLVAARYAVRRATAEDLAGVVMSAPMFGIDVDVPAWKETMGNVLSRMWPSFSMESGLDPSLLSRDPEVCKAYAEDPLVFTKVTSRWYTESVLAQEQALAEAGRFRVPCLLMHSEDDGVNSVTASRAVFERIGVEDKTLKIYEGLHHEIFNELQEDRERVFADLEAWLDAHLP